jgi:hypothetical protein
VTDEEIDTLSLDELNQALWTFAGWHPVIRPTIYPIEPDAPGMTRYWQRGDIPVFVLSPPDYAHDIAAAWGLVETLLPTHRFALAQIDSGRKWLAQFESVEHYGEWEAFEAECHSPIESICRATLKVINEV